MNTRIWYHKTMRNNKGFTLIEVMITLMILIVIVGGVLLVVTRMAEQGKQGIDDAPQRVPGVDVTPLEPGNGNGQGGGGNGNPGEF